MSVDLESFVTDLCALLGKDMDDEGLEELEQVVKEEHERRAEQLQFDRICAICHYISPPAYSKEQKDKQEHRHPMLPKYWWNGVSVTRADRNWFVDGFISVKVSSYVGGGEMDEQDIKIPQKWVQAGANWKQLIDEDAELLNGVAKTAKYQQQKAEAKKALKEAKAKLKQLAAEDEEEEGEDE